VGEFFKLQVQYKCDTLVCDLHSYSVRLFIYTGCLFESSRGERKAVIYPSEVRPVSIVSQPIHPS
jgi:hypothetical protein